MAGRDGWLGGVAAGLVMTATSAGFAQGVVPPGDAAVVQLVERFAAARRAFDPAALAATLAPDFEEVSPIGDVDTRAQVLGFYTPDKRRPGPVMTTDQTMVRAHGTMAIVTQRVSFVPPSAGATPRAVRVRYVAQRSGREWTLVSVQYTPIPPAR